MQKLKAQSQKRLGDLENPKNASNKKLNKGIDLTLSVEDIMQRMEQLKEKVVVEQDTAERERIITRIQALNSAWMELTGEKDAAAASDAKASGKDLATTLKDDLAKYTTQLKEMQAQEETQREEVEDMREKMNASQPVIDRLRQEREVCLTVVRSLWDKIKAINEEYSGMFDSYKEELKEWNARMDVVMADRCVLGFCTQSHMSEIQVHFSSLYITLNRKLCCNISYLSIYSVATSLLVSTLRNSCLWR